MTSIASFSVLPLVDQEKCESYILSKLANDTDLYRQITSDFRDSGLTVSNIDCVQNYNCWLKYVDKKKQIDNRVPQDPAFKLNETYLYHGTTADKAKLCDEGFDVNLSSDGCFGRGIYFSDSPKKCQKYAQNNIILVSRVILGESKKYEDGKRDKMLKQEPEKTGTFKGWRRFDSVMGRPRDFMEYVVYRNESILIEYIVEFKVADPGSQSTDTQAEVIPDIPAAVEEEKKPDGVYSDSSSDEDEIDDTRRRRSTSSSDDEYYDVQDEGSTSSNDEEDDIQDEDPQTNSSDDEPANVAPIEPLFSVIPTFNIKEGELSLDEMKAEFKRITNEEDDSEVDSILEKTDKDLERAIYLFYAYKQVKEEDAKREAGEAVDEEPFVDDGSPIFPPMEPAYESEEWNKLSDNDKKSKMDKVVKDFLSFTALEESYLQVATGYVTDAKYNLDTAVINYYKSWF